MLPSRSLLALTASFAVHALLALAGAGIAAAAAHAPDAGSEEPAVEPWIGETFEIAESSAAGDPGHGQATSTPAAPGTPPGEGVIAVANAAPAPVSTPARPKPRRPKPKPAGSDGAMMSHDATGPAGAGSSGGAWGMAGQPLGGPRNLGRAFTRAIPIAISPDPAWAALPVGPAGSFDLRIELGEDGRIASARPVGAVSEHLRGIGTRTIALLGAGTFAVKAEPGAGAQVLRISASVTMAPGGPPNDVSQAGAYGMGFEAPGADTPGKAWFTLRSGKHVEVSVRVLR